MKILILSFYYYPDLSAGSFRSTALVNSLMKQISSEDEIILITTLPNRYSTFSAQAPKFEKISNLTIHRIQLPQHKSGMLDQSKAFYTFASKVLSITKNQPFDLVYGTSSRLMTASLSRYIAAQKSAYLYLDLRDIFVDTIKDVLPKKIAIIAKPIFSLLERWTVKRANKINLVSKGFSDYFKSRYPKISYSYFPNGIDDIFVEKSSEIVATSKLPDTKVKVLYAGNFGEGQGLHNILPNLAKRVQDKADFIIIGDGGRKVQLQKELRSNGCTNVDVLPPVQREELTVQYQQADVLFLHLNDYDAFRKVLPSKIFEYAAMGKPILAGVSGFAAKFLLDEVSNAVVFEPCNAEQAEKALSQLTIQDQSRNDFVKKYSRKNIMNDMALDLLEGAREKLL